MRGADLLTDEMLRDTGCPDGVHPSCLNCPLARCRFEPGAQIEERRSRQRQEVLDLRARGMSVDEVAERLGISRRAVFRRSQ